MRNILHITCTKCSGISVSKADLILLNTDEVIEPLRRLELIPAYAITSQLESRLSSTDCKNSYIKIELETIVAALLCQQSTNGDILAPLRLDNFRRYFYVSHCDLAAAPFA